MFHVGQMMSDHDGTLKHPNALTHHPLLASTAAGLIALVGGLSLMASIGLYCLAVVARATSRSQCMYKYVCMSIYIHVCMYACVYIQTKYLCFRSIIVKYSKHSAE